MVRAQDLGVFLAPATNSASLKWESAHGKVYNLGGINLQGQLITYAVGWIPNETGHLELAHDNLAGLSEIVGGGVRKTNNPEQGYVVKRDNPPPVANDILFKSEAWLAHIQNYQTRLNRAVRQE